MKMKINWEMKTIEKQKKNNAQKKNETTKKRNDTRYDITHYYKAKSILASWLEMRCEE